MHIASAVLMVSLLLISCSSSSVRGGVSTNEGRTESAQLRDLEKQWISALIRVDRPVINRLRGSEFASEVTGGHSDPIPPWLLASTPIPGRGTWIESNLIVDDLSVRTEGDAAVVTSKQTYHPPSSEQASLERKAQRSYEVEDHWQRRAGGWQVVRRVVRPI